MCCSCGRPHSPVPPPASTTRECGSTASSASPSFTRRCSPVHGAQAARAAAAMVWARRVTTSGCWTPSRRLARSLCRPHVRNAGTLACSGGQRHGDAPPGLGVPQAAGFGRQPVPRCVPPPRAWDGTSQPCHGHFHRSCRCGLRSRWRPGTLVASRCVCSACTVRVPCVAYRAPALPRGAEWLLLPRASCLASSLHPVSCLVCHPRKVTAADIEPRCCELAARNAALNRLRVRRLRTSLQEEDEQPAATAHERCRPDATAGGTSVAEAGDGMGVSNQGGGGEVGGSCSDGEGGEGGELRVVCGDARALLLLSPPFEYAHLDPFGSCTPHLDAFAARAPHGGLISLTATDTAALYAHYPQVRARTQCAGAALPLVSPPPRRRARAGGAARVRRRPRPQGSQLARGGRARALRRARGGGGAAWPRHRGAPLPPPLAHPPREKIRVTPYSPLLATAHALFHPPHRLGRSYTPPPPRTSSTSWRASSAARRRRTVPWPASRRSQRPTAPPSARSGPVRRHAPHAVCTAPSPRHAARATPRALCRAHRCRTVAAPSRPAHSVPWPLSV